VFVNVLQEMKERYDFIIIDSSPLSYAETSVLASKVDGVVLVLEAEKTSWETAQSAHQKLKSSNVDLMGVILNKKKYHIPESIFRLL
jgi:Mrp family chromosome partitioning ATPase